MTSLKLPYLECCLCLLGAYYYYVTEKGRNYEETLLDADKYAKDNNIPYRWFTQIVHLFWFKKT